jgi:hypothetical protein
MRVVGELSEQEVFGTIIPMIEELIRTELGNKVTIEYATLMKLVHSEPFELALSQIIDARIRPYEKSLVEFYEKIGRFTKELEELSDRIEVRANNLNARIDSLNDRDY